MTKQFKCPACLKHHLVFSEAERCYRNHKGSTLAEKAQSTLAEKREGKE